MAVTGTPITAADASGTYIDSGDINNVFGEDNVIRWSQLDNDVATADTNRLTQAITFAEDHVTDRLRNGPYALPFTTCPETVKNIMATLAGVWLYESRGLTDDNEEGNKLQDKKVDAHRDIDLIMGRVIKLDATLAYGDTPTAPTVIKR